MHGGDEDRAARVSSLTNEEPLVVVKACVNIMREVIREDCGDGRGSVVREGETSLRHGRCGSVLERTFGGENGDVSRHWGSGVHRGSEVFALRGGDENIVGIDGNVFVKRGKKESVEDLLGDLGGSGRHRRLREGDWSGQSLYKVLRPGFLRGMFGWPS